MGVACLGAGRCVRPSLTAHTALRYFGAPSANAWVLQAGPVLSIARALTDILGGKIEAQNDRAGGALVRMVF